MRGSGNGARKPQAAVSCPSQPGRLWPGLPGPCNLLSWRISAKSVTGTLGFFFFLVKSMVCLHGRLSSPWTQQYRRLDRVQLACRKADLARNFKNILWFSMGLFASLAKAPFGASGSYYVPKSSSRFCCNAPSFSPDALAIFFYY